MRKGSYGEHYKFTFIDNFGVYLSNKRIIDYVQKHKPKKIIDLGCGYDAVLLQRLLPYSQDLTGVDISTNKNKKIKTINKMIKKDLSFLASSEYDLVIMNNVLEHLEYPQIILTELHRILKKGGGMIVNVPNWRGKWFLEFSAFNLGLSPKEEIDDHKMYYDIKDLWPLVIKAGFKPSEIHIFSHKFGLNTYCVAHKK